MKWGGGPAEVGDEWGDVGDVVFLAHLNLVAVEREYRGGGDVG